MQIIRKPIIIRNPIIQDTIPQKKNIIRNPVINRVHAIGSLYSLKNSKDVWVAISGMDYVKQIINERPSQLFIISNNPEIAYIRTYLPNENIKVAINSFVFRNELYKLINDREKPLYWYKYLHHSGHIKEEVWGSYA